VYGAFIGSSCVGGEAGSGDAACVMPPTRCRA